MPLYQHLQLQVLKSPSPRCPPRLGAWSPSLYSIHASPQWHNPLPWSPCPLLCWWYPDLSTKSITAATHSTLTNCLSEIKLWMHCFSLIVDGSILHTSLATLVLYLTPHSLWNPALIKWFKQHFSISRILSISVCPSLSFSAAETLIHIFITSELKYCNSNDYSSDPCPSKPPVAPHCTIQFKLLIIPHSSYLSDHLLCHPLTVIQWTSNFKNHSVIGFTIYSYLKTENWKHHTCFLSGLGVIVVHRHLLGLFNTLVSQCINPLRPRKGTRCTSTFSE